MSNEQIDQDDSSVTQRETTTDETDETDEGNVSPDFRNATQLFKQWAKSLEMSSAPSLPNLSVDSSSPDEKQPLKQETQVRTTTDANDSLMKQLNAVDGTAATLQQLLQSSPELKAACLDPSNLTGENILRRLTEVAKNSSDYKVVVDDYLKSLAKELLQNKDRILDDNVRKRLRSLGEPAVGDLLSLELPELSRQRGVQDELLRGIARDTIAGSFASAEGSNKPNAADQLASRITNRDDRFSGYLFDALMLETSSKGTPDTEANFYEAVLQRTARKLLECKNTLDTRTTDELSRIGKPAIPFLMDFQKANPQAESQVKTILQTIQRNHERENPQAESKAVEKSLKAQGIDPHRPLEKVRVVACDEGLHGKTVTDVIKHPEWGICKGVDVSIVPPEEFEAHTLTYHSKQLNQQPKDALNNFLSEYATKALDSVTHVILQACEQNKSDKRTVLNISRGISNTEMYEAVLSELLEAPQELRPVVEQLLGEQKAKEWIDAIAKEKQKVENEYKNTGFKFIVGPDYSAASPHTRELLQKIMEHVDKTLANDSNFQTATRQYEDATRKATTNGTIVVVAMGNAGSYGEFRHVQTNQGAETNWLVRGDTIAAGASNNHCTPGDPSDDTVSVVSSNGNKQHHALVLTPGEFIPATTGTSYSAPYLSGTIALMLEETPNYLWKK